MSFLRRSVAAAATAWLALGAPGARGVDAGSGDLRARLDLAHVDGAEIVFADGPPGTPSHVDPTAAAAARFDVNWRSAPDPIVPLDVGVGAADRVLVQTVRGDPLVVARGHDVVVAMEREGALLRWPYFNYVLHAAACDVAGRAPERFADWPGSPVPQGKSRAALVVAVVALWTALVLSFRAARRRGRAHPDAASRFFEAVERSRGPAGDAGEAERSTWTRAGFARPLAGLLTLLATLAFVAGAFLALQWLLSNRVQPFPESDGLWRTTFNALIVVALLFECGTPTATMKYFAEHRVASPAAALADLQFFVWWQFFQRLMQFTVLGVVGALVLPRTEYAIYAVFVAVFGTMGLPSIFTLGKIVCAGLQRTDVQNLLDLAEGKVLIYLMPIPLVLLGRAWGAANPEWGEVYGAALGLAFGHMAAVIVALVIGLWALRRIGVPLAPLFLAQFDGATARRQLAFGAKLSIGSEPIFLLRSVEAVIIIKLLRDFTAWQGVHDLLSTRLFTLFLFSQVFYVAAVPAISEAHAGGKTQLTQYYVARFMQFAMLFHLTIFSLMMAIGPSFIHALGPQWERSTPYLLLAMTIGVVSPPVWLSDSFQQGTGRAWTFLAVMLVEQGSRLALFLLLVPRFQFAGILGATLAATVVKAVVGWTVNHRLVVPLRLSVWSTFAAPAVAGVANYAVWRAFVAFAHPSTSPGILALMCAASASSFFVTFFVCGAAGGFDGAALGELREASRMTSFGRALAGAFSAVAHAGARACPFPVPSLSTEAAARAEAGELDQASARNRSLRSA